MKHAGQICLLLTIFIWLLYLARHSYYKNKENRESSPELLSNGIKVREEVTKFGRKDLINPLRDDSSVKGRPEKDEESVEDTNDGKAEDEEESVAEGRGVGDDDIDVNDQGRAEEEDSMSELEDLIDEEDQEKEDTHFEEGIGGSGKVSQGLRKVKEEDENDAEESTLKPVDRTRGSGSVNGEEIGNREDPSFFRDGLIDMNENSERGAWAERLNTRSILLDRSDDRNAF